jgi:hypothetical protein
LRLTEEGSALLGIVAELMAKDAEGAGGVAEAAGHVSGGFLIDEVSAEGFVLALHGELRGKEEFLVARRRYLIRSVDLHISIVLQEHKPVNMFGPEGRLTSMKRKQQWHKLAYSSGAEREGFCRAYRTALTQSIYEYCTYLTNKLRIRHFSALFDKIRSSEGERGNRG